jgi:hypothetical protein
MKRLVLKESQEFEAFLKALISTRRASEGRYQKSPTLVTVMVTAALRLLGF